MKIIILAGGGGSRLFPLSRKSYPKQFLKLEDEKSLLVHTVERFLDFVVPEDILVVTNQRYLYHVQNELAECQAEGVHIILEPVARNTAPAIGLAVQFCEEKLGCEGRAAGDGQSGDIRHPGEVAGDGLRLHRGGRIGRQVVCRRVVQGEAGSRDSRALCRRGQLLLEFGHVCLHD